MSAISGRNVIRAILLMIVAATVPLYICGVFILAQPTNPTSDDETELIDPVDFSQDDDADNNAIPTFTPPPQNEISVTTRPSSTPFNYLAPTPLQYVPPPVNNPNPQQPIVVPPNDTPAPTLTPSLDTDGDDVPNHIDNCPLEFGEDFNSGCPFNYDRDDDGIRNGEDQCPDDAGPPINNGCPLPDSDSDGVNDDLDACPAEAGSALAQGCPDADNDRIPDKDDQCPSAPAANTSDGCPDSDNDGIPDKDDQCIGVAGVPENNGCPVDVVVDSDNDGIEDSADACPNEAAPNAANGCPDSDGDGFDNSVDACPNQASADNNGCPITNNPVDSDNDGIPDEQDSCPNAGGSVDGTGCPINPIIEETPEIGAPVTD